MPLAPANALHHYLCDEMDKLRTVRGQRLNVLAPRGSAKTTWATFAYPLRTALYAEEPYIIMISETNDQAMRYLSDIKNELENNANLRRDYPGATGRGRFWKSDAIRLRNGVEIGAYGTGAKLRGRKRDGLYRPSLIVIDDPQNRDHIVSPLQRERSWDWLVRDVLNAGDGQTNIVVLGTALHRECIVCRLQAVPGWRSKVFKSMEKWPERMDLWHAWQDIFQDYDLPDEEREAQALAFYRAHQAEMDA